MDESKGEEFRVDNVTERSVTSSSTVINTVTDKFVEEASSGIEKQQGVSVSWTEAEAGDLGNVMAEVSRPEVIVGSGVFSNGLGGENPKNVDGNYADGASGGKVGSRGMHDSASCGVQNVGSESGHEVGSRNGGSLHIIDHGKTDSEIHDVEEKAVNANIGESLERKLDDEPKGDRNLLDGNTGSCNFEASSDPIGNNIQSSTSQVMVVAGGNDAQNNEESARDASHEKHHLVVVESSSMPLGSVSKEPAIVGEGEKQGLSEPHYGNQDDGAVNGRIHSVEATSGDERNCCDEPVKCSSADLSSLIPDDKVVAEGHTQDSCIQSQVMKSDVIFETAKEEGEFIDYVTTISGTANPESSDMPNQLGTEDKNCNADVLIGCRKESDSLQPKASDDIECHLVDNPQFSDLSVKFDGDSVAHGVGDQEQQPHTDEHVVDKESETSAQVTALANDIEPLVTMENVVFSREPQNFGGVTETGDGSKVTVISAEPPENDKEVQCFSPKQKPVSSSEIEQNVDTKPIINADMGSSDEFSFPSREEGGAMDVVLEVKDEVSKSKILQCVKGVGDASETEDEMKDAKGNSMGVDDVQGNKDHSDRQKVDEKIKVDDSRKNGLYPQLECTVEGTSIAGSDIDEVDGNLDAHGIDSAYHQTDSKSNNALIIENCEESLVKHVNQLECEIDTSLGKCMERNAIDGDMQEQAANADQVASVKADSASDKKVNNLHDPVASDVLDKQDMQADENKYKVDEKHNANVPNQETEVPDVLAAGCPALDSDTGSKECGGYAVNDQLPLSEMLDETFDGFSVQRVECEPDASLVEGFNTSATHAAMDDINVKNFQEMQETAAFTQELELPQKQERDRSHVSDSVRFLSKCEKNARRGLAKHGNTRRDHRVTYRLPPEDEGDFSDFDLVWGKVKSHPWWPGQICHPSDASEKAMKYYRKNCYLVAYFGDRSFAWNEASVLKPFRKHFSHEEMQSNSGSFQNAINCAIAEVSRRVELGLACSCISDCAYDKIKYQIIENGGIREESSKREGVDRSTGPDILRSTELIEYVKALAISPTSGADRLELAIAKAQLVALNRLKGCDAVAEFCIYDGLTEYNVENSLSHDQGISPEDDLGDLAAAGDCKTRLKNPHKCKHNLKDIVYQRRKEKNLTELVGDPMCYLDSSEFDSHEEDDSMLSFPSSGSKRKASGYLTEDLSGQRSRKTISFAKVSHTNSSTPQQSFKVGECIRRVASQLAGSPSIIKNGSDESNTKLIGGDDADEVLDDSDFSPTTNSEKQSSQDELLAQLHLSACDPMKGYSFLSGMVSFFSEFRNAAVSVRHQKMRKGSGRKQNPSVAADGSPKTFEFDDRNDSYWTDMVVQNSSQTKPARRGRKRRENKIATEDPGKPQRSTRRKYSRKQYSHGNLEPLAEMQVGDEKKQDNLPTELMLSFVEVSSIPSEVNLNKTFRRFGPLRESETEADMQTGRARVVFKKRSDAEVAYSSATMFNIFGSIIVNYQVNYTPSAPFKTPPFALCDTTEHIT